LCYDEGSRHLKFKSSDWNKVGFDSEKVLDSGDKTNKGLFFFAKNTQSPSVLPANTVLNLLGYYSYFSTNSFVLLVLSAVSSDTGCIVL
jgi:hypothetical protein